MLEGFVAAVQASLAHIEREIGELRAMAPGLPFHGVNTAIATLKDHAEVAANSAAPVVVGTISTEVPVNVTAGGEPVGKLSVPVTASLAVSKIETGTTVPVVEDEPVEDDEVQAP